MKNENYLTGIQQVGIGVVDAWESFVWYNKTLGLNVPVFDDVAEAKLMVNYTKNQVRERRAILAVNMAGGGGAEIWESKRPLPIAADFEPQLGDLGIFSLKIKCQNVEKFAHENKLDCLKNPEGKNYVWLRDNFKNQIQIVEDSSWFKSKVSNTGGVLGVILGVSNIEKSLKLYRDVLGIDEIVYDKTGQFDDLKSLNADKKTFRRVCLRKKQQNEGAFTKLFGNIEIELFQAMEGNVNTIFENRSWGDLGFIHVCFDTINMDKLKIKCENHGFPFVVDSSNSFDMGDAAGRFTYIQDPDGTLIEFVETHKVPILKKIGWYINLQKRKTQRPLPDWMINTIGWGKIKV